MSATAKGKRPNKTSHRDWKRDFEVRCLKLRPKRLKDITTVDVLEVLKPI